MTGRGRRELAPEEAALWKRVIATVTPLEKPKAKAAEPGVLAKPAPVTPVKPPAAPPPVSAARLLGKDAIGASASRMARPLPEKEAANTLDGSWDRRLSRGLVSPESSVDLHGYSLASAYDRLDQGLADAIAHGDRVLLLVTGKPPRPESERPHARGAIRAAVGDWLASSRHADRIAAVRAAHPRHGGSGALYIVLRRTKTSPGRIS